MINDRVSGNKLLVKCNGIRLHEILLLLSMGESRYWASLSEKSLASLSPIYTRTA